MKKKIHYSVKKGEVKDENLEEKNFNMTLNETKKAHSNMPSNRHAKLF